MLISGCGTQDLYQTNSPVYSLDKPCLDTRVRCSLMSLLALKFGDCTLLFILENIIQTGIVPSEHDLREFSWKFFQRLELKNVTLFQENKAASRGTFDLISREEGGSSMKFQLAVVSTSVKSTNLQTGW